VKLLFPLLFKHLNKFPRRRLHGIGVDACHCMQIKKSAFSGDLPVRHIQHIGKRKLPVLGHYFVLIQIDKTFLLHIFLFDTIYFSLNFDIRLFSYPFQYEPSSLHYKFSKNKRSTSAPPINVPIELPKFASTTISNMRVTLLFQKPFTLKTSSERFSKSATLGLRK